MSGRSVVFEANNGDVVVMIDMGEPTRYYPMTAGDFFAWAKEVSELIGEAALNQVERALLQTEEQPSQGS